MQAWREQQVLRFAEDTELVEQAKLYYEDEPVDFINHWCSTYDPRNIAKGQPAHVPLILFPKQAELVEFLFQCVTNEANALIEKSRDMGATWVCASFSVWLWLFRTGAAVGWGSRKQELVDRIGDPSSIFEKIRILVRSIPQQFLPDGFNESDHSHFMRLLNPSTGSTIIGETGDNIGRGGRTLIYFKDESAWYPRPELIEASLLENTRCQVDISSVNGTGNVFYRKRENGKDWTPEQTLSKVRSNVLVMDWSDHPAKTQEWRDQKEEESIASGLLHVFRQEIERNYSATVEGTIIEQKWVQAAIDADKVLGLEIDGKKSSALDVADGGSDTNAQSCRNGIRLERLDEWAVRDTGITARRSMQNCVDYFGEEPGRFQYDAIGVGSGVKAEINRLKDDDLIPNNISTSPWMAGAPVLDPAERVNPRDPGSPRNKVFFQNLKAQAWWMVARMFERTYRAVEAKREWDKRKAGDPNVEDFVLPYSQDSLIVLSSDIPLLPKLLKELSQPTATQSSTMKLMVNKTPDGTKSPNLADCVIMDYWPDTRSLKPRTGASARLIGGSINSQHPQRV